MPEQPSPQTRRTGRKVVSRVSRLFIDERVKYMTIGAFKRKVKEAKRCEFESFKHWDEVWQVEEEAVLVPYEMYQRIQQELAKQETLQ